MKRVLGCTFLGLLVGFLLGFTTAAAGPLNYPGIWLGQLFIECGLTPGGDAGFVVFCWGILLQWVCLGLLVGLALHWRSKRNQSPNKHMQATPR